jgi:hypothetical protein
MRPGLKGPRLRYMTITAAHRLRLPRNILQPVNTIVSPLEKLSIDEFRRQAFEPQQPLLIDANGNSHDSRYSSAADGNHGEELYLMNDTASPIARRNKWIGTNKWFDLVEQQTNHGVPVLRTRVNRRFLRAWGATVLPYELLVPQLDAAGHDRVELFRKILPASLKLFLPRHMSGNSFDGQNQTFHRFNAPLQLFLEASKLHWSQSDSTAQQPDYPVESLYIAQAQIQDLPPQLQNDLPVPSIVSKAGKGDIYDSNIWLGIPPTYTPLHKDPNPNLFLQIASDKVVRLFTPAVGSAIFRDAQQKIGSQGSAAFRGDEMMEGPERVVLDDAVWNCPEGTEGYEVTVKAGDALFIPKGWWHSIKSIGTDVTASANWWFR